MNRFLKPKYLIVAALAILLGVAVFVFPSNYLANLTGSESSGSRPIVSKFETFNAEQISGWAVDPDDPSLPVQLFIWRNGRFEGVVSANKPHPEISALYQTSSGGFSYSWRDLAVGRNLILIQAVAGAKTKLIAWKNVEKRSEPLPVPSSSEFNSMFLSTQVPSEFKAGETLPIVVQFRNTSIAAWTSENFQVELVPGNSTGWAGVGKIAAGQSIGPGKISKFTFNLTAPQISGSYELKWQMKRGTEFFGVVSDPKVITVTEGSSPRPNLPVDYDTIRSTTFLGHGILPESEFEKLKELFPSIRDMGFNTLWLVNPWNRMDPRPLQEPAAYNEAAFANLLNKLQFLKERNFRAILPLNYLGPGWAPQGIDACNWVRDPASYKAFEEYANELLKRIEPYHDMVYVMVFSENAFACEDAFANAKKHATELQATLGSWPNRIPPELRKKFRIGFHDFYIVNRGMGQGVSPIVTPNPFDFLSMETYDTEGKSETELIELFNTRRQRFEALGLNLPILFGEFGANNCNSELEQDRLIRIGLNYFRQNQIGFNLWGYHLLGADLICQNNAPNFGLLRADGSERPVTKTIRGILQGTTAAAAVPAPKIVSSGLTLTWQPWVLWGNAEQLNDGVVLRLFDGGKQWGSDLPIIISPDTVWFSVSLPFNSPPSQCNQTAPCPIEFQLFDPRNGKVSNTGTVELPKL